MGLSSGLIMSRRWIGGRCPLGLDIFRQGVESDGDFRVIGARGGEIGLDLSQEIKGLLWSHDFIEIITNKI
jgi:hypothetical protein